MPDLLRRLAALLCPLVLACSFSAPAGAAGKMVSLFPEDEVRSQSVNVPSDDSGSLGLSAHLRAPLLGRLDAGRSMDSYRRDAMRLYRKPPSTLRGETSLACLAVTVFHEARGEPFKGQLAVASVVLQRAMTPDRWGDTPCDVVRPIQFSFMTSRYGFPPIATEPDWRLAWGRAINAAAHVLSSGPIPEIAGADHYHTKDVHPDWRLQMRRTATIGHHYFYHDPDSAAVPTFR